MDDPQPGALLPLEGIPSDHQVMAACTHHFLTLAARNTALQISVSRWRAAALVSVIVTLLALWRLATVWP